MYLNVTLILACSSVAVDHIAEYRIQGACPLDIYSIGKHAALDQLLLK